MPHNFPGNPNSLIAGNSCKPVIEHVPFGLTLLSHQIGGFLGAWLGGLAVVEFGNYSWMWYADMALAAMAAIINLPIREARIERAAFAT